MKKVFIRTLGCQMNARDSEFVAGILIDDGFALAESAEQADVVLFNSCSVRKHAEDRLFSNIGELAGLKKKRPDLVVGLIGCTAQSYQSDAFARSALVDIVCGPGNEHELPALIRDVIDNGCAIVAADKVSAKRPELFPAYREHAFKAYVSIGEGCDNYCSYCVVPYVRGRERSRDAKDIVREVKDLAARGFKEITLLGQNVNSYGRHSSPVSHAPCAMRYARNYGFVKLLEALNRIDRLERIRFMTSHPKDAHAELFMAMRDLDKVCEHLHLPLQSGSDRMLKLMNRNYTAKKYMQLVDEYRKLVPGGSLTTDIIAGFPSETEADFRKTFSLMKSVGFDSAFTFTYSPRPPAKSAGLDDDVPAAIKARRLKDVIDLQCRCALERNRPLTGTTVEVLVDGINRKDAANVSGRTRTNKTVVLKGDAGLVGKFVSVAITAVTPYALKGAIVA